MNLADYLLFITYLSASNAWKSSLKEINRKCQDLTIHHVCNCCYIVTFTKPGVLMADDCLSTSHTWELLGLPLAHSWRQILLTIISTCHDNHHWATQDIGSYTSSTAYLIAYSPSNKHLPQVNLCFLEKAHLNIPLVTVICLDVPHILLL